MNKETAIFQITGSWKQQYAEKVSRSDINIHLEWLKQTDQVVITYMDQFI